MFAFAFSECTFISGDSDSQLLKYGVEVYLLSYSKGQEYL